MFCFFAYYHFIVIIKFYKSEQISITFQRKRTKQYMAGEQVVSYPSRWSLLFTFGFLWWSPPRQQRNIVTAMYYSCSTAYCTRIVRKIQKRRMKTYICLIKEFQQNLRSIFLCSVQRLNDGDDLSCVRRQASF